jgi:hypothetical protein
MPWTIDNKFRISGNEAVVSFILKHRELSAHDEVASVLTRSARGLSDVHEYCPDINRYAYVLLHTGAHRIFGIAYGQATLAYRLPQVRIAEAVAEGGKPCPEIGPEWVMLDPWSPNGPSTVAKCCKIAHDHASTRPAA